MENPIAVVAIGGNALIKDSAHISTSAQYTAVCEAMRPVAQLIKAGWRVAIAHGNGPQVGFALRRSELSAHELPPEPLDVCGADTQGWIGYFMQQNLHNHLRNLGLHAEPVTLITQVEVDPKDPAFQRPSKPIGAFMSGAEAARRQAEGWSMMEDAGRGWRRVVASPRPVRIVEEATIQALIQAGVIVITVGGGGIPVIADAAGALHGIAAVIDKDFSSALLANRIGADALILCTGVEQVAIHYGQPNQAWLGEITLAQAKAYLAEGIHFAKGSMAPKIEAAIQYLEHGGTRVIITNMESISRAVTGATGTHIIV